MSSGVGLIKPTWLLADSSPFFHTVHGPDWFAKTVHAMGYVPTRAFYVGHANDFAPAHFEIFRAAAAPLVGDACFALKDERDWAQAWRPDDWLVFAGGDPAKLSVLTEGIAHASLQRAKAQGVFFTGISAGAVFLGGAWTGGRAMLGWLPYVIGAHEEAEGWAGLKARAALVREPALMGIPWRSVVAVEWSGRYQTLLGSAPFIGNGRTG